MEKKKNDSYGIRKENTGIKKRSTLLALRYGHYR